MASTNRTSAAQPLPDWWQREKQRRQLGILIFLGVLLLLIGSYYWESVTGRIGLVGGVNFDTANYIAFVRQDKGKSALYAVRADGSGMRRLSNPDDNSEKLSPAWTADGKSILYVSDKSDSQFRQIYILGDGDPRQLTYGKSNKDSPVASPDHTHVAFLTQGAVKTVDINGNDVYQVMPPPRAGNQAGDDTGQMAEDFQGPFLTESFSSDGSGIAGVQEVQQGDSPVDMNGMQLGDQAAMVLPSNGPRSLLLDTGHEVSLSWEPRGNRVACAFTELEAQDPHGNQKLVSGIRIWTIDPSGRTATPKPIFQGLGYSVEPKNVTWSPDGTKLAFEGWRLKGRDNRQLGGIMVLDVTAPGSGIVVLPQNVSRIQHAYMVPARPGFMPQNPHWSPDGSRIYYEAERPDGGHDIWVVNTDGTNAINLTKGMGDNIDPAWSPAGSAQ